MASAETETAAAVPTESQASTVVPIIFCIDAEPDDPDPPRDDNSPWHGVEKCFTALEGW